ncbi:MAG: heme lyase CcmF/NrfE family subunit [Burkholderiales bacterium]|nr:heme lyase CcmF/NrfE family subunit [Burkholderiales bacterium]
MIPELGHFALILATVVALLQATLPFAGVARGDAALMSTARVAACVQAVLIAFAFGCLAAAFLGNDFSVDYVASNSNSKLPAIYRFTAVWGGHEGSMLLWMLMLGGWSAAVAVFSRHLPLAMVARILGVLGMVSIGFHLFLLLTSNPFERLIPMPPDGRDLNPLLQDPGMIIHPPLLYMGYVGFSIAFAFAIAALMGGKLDATWARWSRPWTVVAWLFLTLGIALGSAWAYYELGWGGWWFWDPVENASFMPWLVGTALIHSLAVTEKRGAFRAWTVLLAILAFSMSLLGTFLVRSGVLTSVHAFATDPRRGVFILAFLVVVIGGSLSLFAARAPKVGAGGSFEPVSRESMLLGNNILLMVAAASVLLGTLYPLLLDALGLGKISVGPPYFESVFVPLMTPVVFLMGVGAMARWKKAAIGDLARRLRWAIAVSVVSAALVPFAMGAWSVMVALGMLLAAWAFTSTAANLIERIRPRGEQTKGWGARMRELPASYIGMLLAHAGVGVFIVGVTMVNGYESEKDVRMQVGDAVALGGHTFRFAGVSDVQGPNYVAARGRIEVRADGSESVKVLEPEKRIYTVQRQPMTEAAIDSGLFGDLYVALGEQVGEAAWTLRLHIKPFVDWIWGGCTLMALGGLIAICDRRYRRFKRALPDLEPKLAPHPTPSPAAGAARSASG